MLKKLTDVLDEDFSKARGRLPTKTERTILYTSASLGLISTVTGIGSFATQIVLPPILGCYYGSDYANLAFGASFVVMGASMGVNILAGMVVCSQLEDYKRRD